MKKVCLVLAVMFLFITFFISCSHKETTEQIIYRSMPSFVTLDPQVDLNIEVGFIARHIFSRLLENDKNGKIQPSLLKEMPKVSDDGLVYSFELKRGVKFTNGVEMKSSDVKYTFERMLWPETKGQSTWVFDTIKGAKNVMDAKTRDLSGFKIIDDYRFEVQLEYPYAPFLYGLATPFASIFPEKACVESGNRWASTVIGSGPFKISKTGDKNELVMDRNESYFGKNPQISRIVNKIIDKSYIDFAQVQAEYDLGRLDIISVPADKYAEYKNNPKYKNELKCVNTFNTRYLTLNNQNPILSDRRVRQAISMAIDREKLCNIILKESAVPAYTIIPSGINGYDGDAKIEFNIEKSKSLLMEAGYPNGFSIDYYQRLKTVLGIDFAIQSMLEQIGIKLNMISVDENKYKELNAEGKLTMCQSNWWADIPDADNFLYNLFYSKLGRSSKYNSELFDSLCDEARKINDPVKRNSIYKRLDNLVCTGDWATIPISHNIEIILSKENLVDAYIDPVTSIPVFCEAYKK